MAGSRVTIVNGTDDDATCKVSGALGDTLRETEWRLPKKKTLKPLVPAPCTLHFSVEIGDKKVTPAVKELKLTKDSKGYRIEVVTNGRGVTNGGGASGPRNHAESLTPPAPAATAPSPEQEEIRTVAGERSESLARKHGGERLSSGEQGRLEELTARLKEKLPPVSADDLETLLEMAEDAERIRERARERRRRLS